ncbi:hypothetical protein BN2476_2040010 [Paraburkholderia piptadeniae]|uniref:Uncharacterized protein n=1 Tax=Paraburkholderia piptadeniae TaxID=1701573 RepID=A0A1N7SYV1_9BURK|nr:hypothetical protein BN2476_2040010 [Paraburkholderia piptadeniae]
MNVDQRSTVILGLSYCSYDLPSGVPLTTSPELTVLPAIHDQKRLHRIYRSFAADEMTFLVRVVINKTARVKERVYPLQ